MRLVQRGVSIFMFLVVGLVRKAKINYNIKTNQALSDPALLNRTYFHSFHFFFFLTCECLSKHSSSFNKSKPSYSSKKVPENQGGCVETLAHEKTRDLDNDLEFAIFTLSF